VGSLGSGEPITENGEHLAGYKTPKSVEIVESLPRNLQGKILKRELRKKYLQE
jgi:long-chain acyl-CoA synthetase